MRPSLAPARSSRLAGAAGALLLQGGFLVLFLMSMPVLRPPAALERELSLIIPRLRVVPPLPAPEPSAAGPANVTPPLPLFAEPAITAPMLALPSTSLPGLKGFGQALNDCAPEKYAALTLEQRAGCPRPGAGMALEQGLNLSPPSHSKDAATWQEDWNEAHWMPGLCGTGSPEGDVTLCMMHQSIAESERGADAWYHIDKAKTAARH